MTIQLGGLVSGLDTDTVIQQLLDVDSRIKKNLEKRKTGFQEKKDLFDTFNTKLLSFKTQSDAMLLSGTFQKRSAASTDNNIVSASVADGAAPGTYSILIDNLATSSTRQSTAKINTNLSRRSTSAVSPGTTPVDLTDSFANNITRGLLPSTLNPATTVTVDSDGDTNFTSAALSTYSSVQSFLDAINNFDYDSAAGTQSHVNAYYDSTNDRFVIERKNNAGAGALSIQDSAMSTGFFTNVGLMTSAESPGPVAIATNASGLNVNALLKNLNTDTAVASGQNSSFKLNGVSISYNTDTDTLQNLIDRINNNTATTGVVAFYDQSIDRLSFRRTSEGPQTITLDTTAIDTAFLFSGATPRLKMTTSTGFTNGEQAKFFINETTDLASATLITADSNTYTFNGITINLKRDGNNSGTANITTAPVDPSATVTVTQDVASVSTVIKSFVTAYNDIAQFYVDNASFDQATKKGKKLFGDSLLGSVDSKLKRLLFQPQSSLTSTHQLLAQLGIQLGDFNSEDKNKLVVDDTQLNSAIASNAPAVEQLFGRSTTGSLIKNAGIAYDISNYITELTKFKGLVDIREDGITTQITDVDKSIAREDDRLTKMETSLRRQFRDMETALSRINSQGASVVQQLSRL